MLHRIPLLGRLFGGGQRADPETLNRHRQQLADELAKTERRMKAKGCSTCV